MSDSYDLNNEPLVISKSTMDLFLKTEFAGELIGLYSFYYYTAKWQKTNQPRCTTGYAANGLNWTEDKVRKHKKTLVGFGLVSDVQIGNVYYISVKYIWTREHARDAWNKCKQPYDNQGGLPESGPTDSREGQNSEPSLESVGLPESGPTDSREGQNSEPNALSADSKDLHTLSTDSKEGECPEPVQTRSSRTLPILPPDPIKLQDIVDLWNKEMPSPIPRVAKLTDQRRPHLKARLDDLPTIEGWKDLFKMIRRSSFLTGRGGDWFVDFDWVIKNDGNLIKILEGKYDDKGSQPVQPLPSDNPAGYEEGWQGEPMFEKGARRRRNKERFGRP
jgi:hypothetical protein